MKIVNTEQGQAYHLTPGTELECERTNPFFNERGEQSLPVSLPDTDHNRKLLLYPEQLQRKAKAPKRIAATIEDGDFYMPCRQAILGAQRNAEISTSFYMNEGAFYSKLSDITLAMVFGEETIPGIDTVEKGIDYCQCLMKGTDPNFAIFPVWVDEHEEVKPSYTKYYGINRYILDKDSNVKLRNAVTTKIVIDEKDVSIPAGYYITPFIRANYLLKRVISYLGYTLNENFFTRTKPFQDMVFINNCIDTLANGTIKLVDLVPDCTCAELLELFRKKFCAEFIPNELDKTMDLVLFNDIDNTQSLSDLSRCVTSQAKIEYPEAYSQISLKAKESVDKNSADKPQSFVDFKKKYPTAQYDSKTRTFFREVYKGEVYGYDENGIHKCTLNETIPGIDTYCLGDDIPVEEIMIPECIPSTQEWKEYLSNYGAYKDAAALYVGDSIAKHSQVHFTDNSTDKESDHKQAIILAFACIYNSLPWGSYDGTIGLPSDNYSFNLNYSLAFSGDKGIYEKFYKKLDIIKRNSMHKVTVDILLSNDMKKYLPAHLPVTINGQKLLINNLKYNIGGKDAPQECHFLTTKLYAPIDYPASMAEMFPKFDSSKAYHWVPAASYKTLTKEEYESSPYKGVTFQPIYPPFPSAKYDDGQIHFGQTLLNSDAGYYLKTLGLRASKSRLD